ncbi:MAG: hypothetical protein ABUS57_03905 [Pseudomonadota bacterium]
MPTTLTADHPSPFGAALRALGLSLLGLAAILAFVFAAAAALVIGLVVAGAALALHFMPRRVAPTPDVLEARKTPTGWVVETNAQRR